MCYFQTSQRRAFDFEADKKMLNPDLNASDNRMAAGQGWSYDAAGNVIADPQGRSFI